MTKPTGAQIRKAVAYWQVALGLEDWSYTVKVGPMPKDEWGEAVVELPYKKVHFRFYPKRMHQEGESVDEMAVHEWVHSITERFADLALSKCRTQEARDEMDDEEEALTTAIARLILRLHKRPRE